MPELDSRICRVVFRRVWEDAFTENVFHVWREGPHDEASAAVVAAAVEAWWQGTGGVGISGPSVFDPVHTGLVPRLGLVVLTYVPAKGLPFVARFASAGVEAGANVPAPQAAVVVRWKTGRGGKGRLGWTFHGFIPDSMYEGEREGCISEDARGALELSYQALITQLTNDTGVPGEFAPVLVHRKPRFPSDSDTGRWDFIVDAEIVDRRVRTQRRRVPRWKVPPGGGDFILPG